MPAEDTSAQPLRPKANLKVQRAPNTPTKSKAVPAEEGTSPSMLDFFKASKISQLPQSSQETIPAYENPLAKLISTKTKGGDDPFASWDAPKETHSRRATSKPLQTVRRTTKRAMRPTADEAIAIVENASSDIASSRGALDNETEPRSGGTSSPVARRTSECAGSPLQNVTQRTPRRRNRKGYASPKIQSTNGSPVRSKKPIESFFKPYLKSRNQVGAPADMLLAEDAIGLIAVPFEPTTDLTTTIARATHIHAVPRSSLPGTWKEIDCAPGPKTHMTPASRSRAPRVSIVDLTSD